MQPFWTRRKMAATGAMVTIVALMTGSAYTFRSLRSRVDQPIQFNHRIHTAQMECSACHIYYTQGSHSGLPDASICSLCHETVMSKSPEEARLHKILADGKPLVFSKLFHLPDHVYYSHRRHVVSGKVECVQCHGAIAATEAPPSRPLVEVTMKYCVHCHEKSKVTTDCNSCHR